VNGKEKAWSNSLRAKEESGRRHDHVLEALRKLMKELPVSIVAPNFREVDYLDKHGQMRPMIEFSEGQARTGLTMVTHCMRPMASMIWTSSFSSASSLAATSRLFSIPTTLHAPLSQASSPSSR
jgi:hypothetical protein